MNKPPDYLMKPPNIPSLQWDNSKTLNIMSDNQIYLTMTRINSTENLSSVSPFLIKKAIDATCGEIDLCKKIRSGQILLKTKNSKQAHKLCTLTALSNNILVNIALHPTLNFSKGVIYCNDLRDIPEKEILDELASQNVCEVKKIFKKIDNHITETGLAILTFSSASLPNKINIGYLKIPIRPYIPLPMRCKNCLKYNHLAKFCKTQRACSNCAHTYHLDEENNEICKENTKCVNCDANKLADTNHNALDRRCPIFLREKEIQAIRITSNVDNKTARDIYRERHQYNNSSYSTISKQQDPQPPSNTQRTTQQNTQISHKTPYNKTTIPTPTTNITVPTSTPSVNREIVQYTDILTESSDNEIASTSKQNIKILPRNTPKRLLSKIKKISPTSKTKQPLKIPASISIPNFDYPNLFE